MTGRGSIYHLLMHALGIGHANNRRDSNSFVYKNKRNIVPVEDYESIPVYKFFENNNVIPPDTELYYRIQPNRSVTFMDPMAWSKYSSLAVISPTSDIMNPVSWQRSFASDDKLFLQFLYCRPPTKVDPCHIYNNAARSKPDYAETYRNVKQCPDIFLSKTTFRIPIKLGQHFGANVTFRCKIDGFIMFGDRVRTCLRNGEWSGEQPFCMPPELIQYYCTYAISDKKCQRIKAVKDTEKLQKRSVNDEHLRPYQYIYDVDEMKAVSHILCIGFTYLVQASTKIEVHLKQNHNWKMIWNGLSANVYSINRVEIEANVKKGKTFAVRVIAKYDNGVTQQFDMIYMHIFADSCDVK
ncbi:hypothetical protein B4U80_12823 [Leptotrombidium deliense]|uniref:Sushi domain-containing protein n=1 Tax=Leptotrombidium deliense TaxID=299467 RepID=A0A443SKF6_9ACAR|nr:hypothetical protein B4U80_12823 [Leptotrombidium deliense]